MTGGFFFATAFFFGLTVVFLTVRLGDPVEVPLRIQNPSSALVSAENIRPAKSIESVIVRILVGNFIAETLEICIV